MDLDYNAITLSGLCQLWMDSNHARRLCPLLHKCQNVGCRHLAISGRYGDVLHCEEHERKLVVGTCSVCDHAFSRWTKVTSPAVMLVGPASRFCDLCGYRFRCRSCGANPARGAEVDLDSLLCSDCSLPCSGQCGLERTLAGTVRRRMSVTRPVPHSATGCLPRAACPWHDGRACQSCWYNCSPANGSGPPLLCSIVEGHTAFQSRWRSRLAAICPRLPPELRDAILEFMDHDICLRCESPRQTLLRQLLLTSTVR